MVTDVNLRWPFVGNQFNGFQWKSVKLQDNVLTTIQVKMFSNKFI